VIGGAVGAGGSAAADANAGPPPNNKLGGGLIFVMFVLPCALPDGVAEVRLEVLGVSPPATDTDQGREVVDPSQQRSDWPAWAAAHRVERGCDHRFGVNRPLPTVLEAPTQVVIQGPGRISEGGGVHRRGWHVTLFVRSNVLAVGRRQLQLEVGTGSPCSGGVREAGRARENVSAQGPWDVGQCLRLVC